MKEALKLLLYFRHFSEDQEGKRICVAFKAGHDSQLKVLTDAHISVK